MRLIVDMRFLFFYLRDDILLSTGKIVSRLSQFIVCSIRPDLIDIADPKSQYTFRRRVGRGLCPRMRGNVVKTRVDEGAAAEASTQDQLFVTSYPASCTAFQYESKIISHGDDVWSV